MKTFLKIFPFLYSPHVRRVEKKIGYRVTFPKIPDIWINGVIKFDMKKSLAKHGIRASCVDYFTMGALVNDNISARFDRKQIAYQSWLGAYLVKFQDNRKFTLQDHFNLAIADQKNWLGDFGDPSPYCEMSPQNFVESGIIKIGEYSGILYEDLGSFSHSDVGSKNNNASNRRLMSLMAAMFNDSNPALDLEGRNFIPKDIETEYEKIILKGYIAVINLEPNISVVLYGNGASLLGENNEELKDYTSLLKEDILTAFRNVNVTKA